MLVFHVKCISSVQNVATLRRWSWDGLEDGRFDPTPASLLGRGVVPDRLEVFVVSGGAAALADELRVFAYLAAPGLGLHTESMLSSQNSRNLLA